MEKALDRINDAYYGKLGESLQVKTRERVNWIINNVHGREVLDVGCSQGLVTILAGREGKKILGLDILEESIGIAQEYLETESESVKSNVTFECSNFITRNFNNKFDTIIASEVLEHIGDTGSFMRKAKELLTEDGRVVVTVPFGINDYFDHKRTYYFYDLIKSLGTHFYIDRVEFLGKWVGVLCINKESSLTTSDYLEKYSSEFEKALYQIERDYLNTIHIKEQRAQSLLEEKKQVLAKLNDANEKYRIACANIDEYKNQIKVLKENEKYEKENKHLLQQIEELRKKAEELRKKAEECENNKVVITNYEKTVERQSRELETLAGLGIKFTDLMSQFRSSEQDATQKQHERYEQLLSEHYKLRGLYESNEKSLEERMQLLQGELNELTRKFDDTNAKYINMRSANEVLQKAAQEKDKTLAELKQAYGELARKLDNVNTSYLNTKSAHEALHQSAADKERGIVELKKANNELARKLDDANTKYKFIIGQNNDYKNKVTKLTNENDYFKSEIKALMQSELNNLDEQEKLIKIIRNLQNNHNKLKRAKLVRLSYKYWGFMNKIKGALKGGENELSKK
jgi:SAM-dependent methyltransferase